MTRACDWPSLPKITILYASCHSFYLFYLKLPFCISPALHFIYFVFTSLCNWLYLVHRKSSKQTNQPTKKFFSFFKELNVPELLLIRNLESKDAVCFSRTTKLMDAWFRCQKQLSMIQNYGLVFERETNGNNLRRDSTRGLEATGSNN